MPIAAVARLLLMATSIAVGVGPVLVASSVERGQGRPNSPAPGEVRALATGKLLIASRDLRDPNFVESVVLLVEYNNKGAVGLVVNARTDVPLSRIFEHLDLGVNAVRQAFAGGPVSRTTALALTRSRAGAAEGRPVTGGISLLATRDLLERSLKSAADPDRFRVYLGYAGWGPEQLEREIGLGAWHVLNAEPNLVFDEDPATLWRRLIRRTEMLLASASPGYRTIERRGPHVDEQRARERPADATLDPGDTIGD